MICELLQPLHSRNPDALDLNQTENQLVYDVRKFSTAAVQAIKNTTWGTAVITVYRSLDGYTMFDLEGAAETLGPGSDFTATLDVSAVAFLILKVTTLEGSAVTAKVLCVGKASS